MLIGLLVLGGPNLLQSILFESAGLQKTWGHENGYKSSETWNSPLAAALPAIVLFGCIWLEFRKAFVKHLNHRIKES